ncbi:EAL domain-containing protein [Citreimonas salinaria]|uniref:Diguanylate cyclase (GGDEF) domain-containing protein n=1 Tax=Citreimonas salinaria TaxID=321339 RepID=A0A1H3H7S8_9RHOB|nr:EAL domain-containing protein [Citreimonas salinaria]SDY11511.1 diguanylate cyclase (GGDEF) domain-containing protein [Citreimonas salinaria]
MLSGSGNLSRLTDATPAVVTGLVVGIAMFFDLLAPLDVAIGDLRMGLSAQPVSGQVVYVAIDEKSLKAVGQWPWPRNVHGALLDRFTEAGARDVFFDVDFAFAGDPQGDLGFIDALERAGGATYLPVFAQPATIGGPGPETLGANMPHAPFLDLSWPVLVNVPADGDGLVRHYYYSAEVAGEDMASAASYLSGAFGPRGEAFAVNYALRPDTVPSHSAINVLRGDVAPDAFAGKSVIVGAHAVELRDNFAVPVHGIVPGPVIHALAAETLMQEVVPTRRGGLSTIALLCALIVLLQRRDENFSAWTFIAKAAFFLIAVELGALVLFQRSSVQWSTAPFYPGILLYGAWRLGQTIDISRWVIRGARVEIENTRRLLEQVFNDSSDTIIILDEVLHVRTASKSAMEMGIGRGEAALPVAFADAARDAIRCYRSGAWRAQPLAETRLGDRILQFTVTPSVLEALSDGLRTPAKQEYIATIAARDITHLRKQEEKLAYLSAHDERTGALRRQAFLRLVHQHLLDHGRIAVFAFNLHRFKTINTTLGRDVGDLLLAEVVRRLLHDVERLSPVVRLDGDSFALFATCALGDASPADLAEQIHESVTRPYELSDARALVGARVGYFDTGEGTELSAQAVLDQAEDALDEARQFGGSRIARHDPDKTRRKTRARDIERAMWTAIDEEELSLVYQPQVDMRDGRLIGVEALLRWTSPTLGRIFPDEFIAVAESNGFIRQIGRWVLHRAALDARLLPADVTVAANVSALQMLDHGILDDVQSALSESAIPPARLWLELTETALMSPSDCIIESMRDIEMLGVSWALDDFGTGYSSLAYLSRLPLRKLKLDKSFVQNLDTDAHAMAILRSVNNLCRNMDLCLLCEGVETRAHADILLGEGCVEAQGYFYGKPQSLEEVIDTFCGGATQVARRG